MHWTSVRISTQTHAAVKELSSSLGMSAGDTVALAVRRLVQSQMGRDLREPLTEEEAAWLEADLS